MKKNSATQKAEKRKKAQEFHRLASLADKPAGASFDNVSLSPRLAINDQIREEVEGEHLMLIFESYNHKECELTKLGPEDSKRLIETFNKIQSLTPSTLISSRIIKDTVEPGGNYASLYDGLGSDVSIIEVEFTDPGRIFAYVVNRCFCVVAIKVKHVKVRGR